MKVKLFPDEFVNASRADISYLWPSLTTTTTQWVVDVFHYINGFAHNIKSYGNPSDMPLVFVASHRNCIAQIFRGALMVNHVIPTFLSCLVKLVRDTPTSLATFFNGKPVVLSFTAFAKSHFSRLCSREWVLWSTTSRFSGLLSALLPLMWWTDSFGANGRPSFMLAISRCSFNFLPPNEAVL